jgi:hypothetical protein
MKIFQKKKAGVQPQSKLEKRISGISTSELITWIENYLAEIGKNVAGIGEKTPDRYKEALSAAEIVVLLVAELNKRSNV